MRVLLLSDRRQPKESQTRNSQRRGLELARVLQLLAGDDSRTRLRVQPDEDLVPVLEGGVVGIRDPGERTRQLPIKDETESLARFQIHFDSKEEAYAEAKRANIIGFVYFAPNFTASVKDTLDNGREALNGSFETREIQVQLDMSNQQNAYFLERKLREAYGSFAQKLMTDCELPARLATIPVNFQKPVYSSFDADFQEYAAPGVIMT